MNATTCATVPTMAVIDSDPRSYAAVMATLAHRFHFLTATTAESALRAANGQAVWLWLIGARLPDTSGAEFCRLLRWREPAARVVVVGDSRQPDEEVACRMAGVTGFFGKPLDIPLFTAFVEQLCRAELGRKPAVMPRAVLTRHSSSSFTSNKGHVP